MRKQSKQHELLSFPFKIGSHSEASKRSAEVYASLPFLGVPNRPQGQVFSYGQQIKANHEPGLTNTWKTWRKIVEDRGQEQKGKWHTTEAHAGSSKSRSEDWMVPGQGSWTQVGRSCLLLCQDSVYTSGILLLESILGPAWELSVCRQAWQPE